MRRPQVQDHQFEPQLALLGEKQIGKTTTFKFGIGALRQLGQHRARWLKRALTYKSAKTGFVLLPDGVPAGEAMKSWQPMAISIVTVEESRVRVFRT